MKKYNIVIDRNELQTGKNIHQQVIDTLATDIGSKRNMLKRNPSLIRESIMAGELQHLKKCKKDAESDNKDIYQKKISAIKQYYRGISFPKVNSTFEWFINPKRNSLFSNLFNEVTIKDIEYSYGLKGDYLLLDDDCPIAIVELKRTFIDLKRTIDNNFLKIVAQNELAFNQSINFTLMICKPNDEGYDGCHWEDIYFNSNGLSIGEFRKCIRLLKNPCKKDASKTGSSHTAKPVKVKYIEMDPTTYKAPFIEAGHIHLSSIKIQHQEVAERILDHFSEFAIRQEEKNKQLFQ